MRMLITILILSGLFLCLPGNIISADQNYLPKADLIKGSGPEVYLLESGIRHWITSPEIFNFFNYNWRNIKTYSDSVIKNYPIGDDWDEHDDYPDGTLLKGSGLKVYLIELEKKRWIPNPKIFTENNFGWEYIINVNDDILDDFDNGDNLVLSEPNRYPETIILESPSRDEVLEKTEISFKYSGTNPLGSAKDLTFETYLEGYDSRWHNQGSSYTEKYSLPNESKAYTFYVRAKNEEGYYDLAPASISFQIGVSPYQGEVEIYDISYDEDDFKDDYLIIKNKGDEPVNIIDWTIEITSGTITIPQAIHKLRYPVSVNIPSNINLNADDKINISLRTSPQGYNFRINKCTGYLDQSEQFYPSLDEDCPILKESEYSHLKIACREFIDDLDKCELPNYSGNYTIGSDSECTGFLNDKFNYQQCYEDYYQEADFFGDEWRVFLGKSIDIFNNESDTVILRDRNGLKVDEYSY